MGPWGARFLVCLALALGGCAGVEERGTDEPSVRAERRQRRHRRHRRHRRRARRARARHIVVRTGAPLAPARRVLRGVCVPVASCGRFAGCAFAEEEANPDSPGAVRYRVRRYETDPSRVDQVFEWGRLCWAEGPGRACVDALDAGGRCPADAPAPAAEPVPRCVVEQGICGPETSPPAADGGADP